MHTGTNSFIIGEMAFVLMKQNFKFSVIMAFIKFGREKAGKGRNFKL